MKALWQKFYAKHAGYYIKIRAYQRIDGRYSWILREEKTDWEVNSESIPTATFDTAANAVEAAKHYFHKVWPKRQPKGWNFVKIVAKHWWRDFNSAVRRKKDATTK